MFANYNRVFYGFIFVLCALFLSASINFSFAKDSSSNALKNIDLNKKYNVGVIIRKPYGYVSNNVYTGISVDIWKTIADKNNIKYEFVPIYDHGDEALKNLKEKKIDVLIGDISVVSSYLKSYDFSRPYYIDRLSVVGVHENESLGTVLLKIFGDFFKSYFFYLVSFLVVIVILVSLFEKKVKNKYYKGKSLIGRLFLSFYSTSVCFWGNNEMPFIRSTISRILCVISLFISIFVVSVVVGVVTASVTISSSNLSTHGGEDGSVYTLYNEPVVVIQGSYAASAAKELGATILEADNIETAFQIANDNSNYQVMGGYLPIKYFLMDNPKYKLNNKAIAAGANEIAFAFRQNDPLLLPINLTLTSLQENNKVFQICKGTLSVADSLDCQI